MRAFTIGYARMRFKDFEIVNAEWSRGDSGCQAFS